MFKYAWVRIFWVQRLEPVHNIGFQTVAGRHKTVQMRHKLLKLGARRNWGSECFSDLNFKAHNKVEYNRPVVLNRTVLYNDLMTFRQTVQ